MTTVRIEKRKFDGTLRRSFEADDLGRRGEWIVVYHDASRHESLKDGRPASIGPHGVLFLSTREPLTVGFHFDADGRLDVAQADAALPATVEDAVVAFVDLDIDLIVAPDGSYFARDFDTLEQNAREMGYSPEAIAAAGEGLRLARALVDGRRFPFDGSAQAILASILAGAPDIEAAPGAPGDHRGGSDHG